MSALERMLQQLVGFHERGELVESPTLRGMLRNDASLMLAGAMREGITGMELQALFDHVMRLPLRSFGDPDRVERWQMQGGLLGERRSG